MEDIEKENDARPIEEPPTDITTRIPTYKIYQLDENEITKRIIVFRGNAEPVVSLNEVFSDLEVGEIEAQKTEIIFSKLRIHPDDTIETIKLKLVMELGDKIVSYNEIYLYSKIQSSLFLENFYRDVTQNDQTPFTANMLGQLLINLQWDKTVVEGIPVKDTYSYEDLVKWVDEGGGEGPNRDILIPLGMRFSGTRNLLFSPNPFELLPSDSVVFQQNASNPLLAFMNSTLLSHGPIVDNKIYVSFLDNVLEYASRNGVDEKYVLQLYFPELKDENISSFDDFLSRKQEFIRRNEKLITRDLLTLYKTVDLFWNVQASKTREFEYVSRGIHSFEIVFHPEAKILLPLEAIFKNVHATRKMPFIKYNPGNRRENIYRFYYDKMTKTGKKIPVLKKAKIVALSKQSGKSRQISFYLLRPVASIGGAGVSGPMELFIDIQHNGDIIVRSDLSEPILLVDLENIFKEIVDPFIQNVNAFLQQSGYKLNTYSSLYDETVEIVKLKYACSIRGVKPFDLKKYVGCLTSVFEVIETNLRAGGGGGALLRFKRVDNYKRMNAIHAMIADVFKRTNDEVAVLNNLMVNYNLTRDEATMQFANFLNDHHRIQGKFVNKSVDLLDSPGFPVAMKFDMENLIVEVENIYAIQYIDILQVYIDSFLQIVQVPETLRIGADVIRELCLRAKEIPVAAVEENKPENVIVPVIDKTRIQALQFGKKYDDEDADVDEEDDDEDKIFFDEDEDEVGVDDEADGEGVEGDGEDEAEEVGGVRGVGGTSDADDTFSRYFLQKKKNLEPTLFLTAKEGQYKAYTRACPLQRQPVILTEEEKQKIDREHRDAYSYALRYGTDPNKKYWYICPRFWCMKTNEPLTEDEVAKGECQGSIREFTSNEHIKNGQYVKHYPGFLPKDTHPTSCVPCCMRKNWDTNKQQHVRRNECNIDEATDVTRPGDAVAPVAGPGPIQAPKKSDTTSFYIVGFDKYPIPKERWGFLPPSIQLFLQINYNDVTVKKTPSLIKNGSTTFLRYGVEQSRHQSFLGCIADIYASVNRYKADGKPVPSIKEFRGILQESIGLDQFIRSHNGSLVSIFQPPKSHVGVDVVSKYSNTEFYSRIHQTDENQVDFLEDTIASFENFLRFLGDDDALIDHTYMWDIVTSKNTKLFPNGLNLVVMEIVDNDITDNVEILCPTNSYMDKFYDPTRETVILLKHGEYYEPIYMYNISHSTATDRTVTTTETFSAQVSPPELKRVLGIIQKSTNKYCRALPSMPRVYQFKQNIAAIKLLRILKTYQYHVAGQVSNYRGKIIGLLVAISKDAKTRFLVPSFPSAQIVDLPLIYIDDVPWQGYEETRDFLINVADTTKNEVTCRPAWRVVDRGMIVGLFTETNQYIQVDKPITDVLDDGIPVYNSVSFSDNGYIEADKVLAKGDALNVDEDRTKVTRRVLLETQFYTAFRTTIRIVLNEFRNREARDRIIKWIEDAGQFHGVKLKKIELVLQAIMENFVVFNDIPDNLLDDFGEISTCLSDCKGKKYCLVKDTDGDCALIIPSKNLITGEDNLKLYYARISDELLRYKRIQMFLLNPKKYLNIADVEYKINTDEIVLLQSIIDSDYFDNLVPVQLNKYVKNVPFDVAAPSITQRYSSDVGLDEQTTQDAVGEDARGDADAVIECIQEVLPSVVGNERSFWKKTFPIATQEIVFNNTKDCTFYLIIDVIQKHLKATLSIANVKTALIRKYREVPQHLNKVLTILAKQGGKRKLIDKVVTSRLSLEDLIMSEEYFLTNLDLWAIASLFNLPILLFSSKNLENLSMNVNWVILGGNRASDTYYCIRSSVEKGTIPQYHLVKPGYKLSSLNNFEGMVGSTSYIENNLDFVTYLATHM